MSFEDSSGNIENARRIKSSREYRPICRPYTQRRNKCFVGCGVNICTGQSKRRVDRGYRAKGVTVQQMYIKEITICRYPRDNSQIDQVSVALGGVEGIRDSSQTIAFPLLSLKTIPTRPSINMRKQYRRRPIDIYYQGMPAARLETSAMVAGPSMAALTGNE